MNAEKGRKMANDNEYEFTDEGLSENVRPFRSRADKQDSEMTSKNQSRSQYEEESFDNLYAEQDSDDVPGRRRRALAQGAPKESVERKEFRSPSEGPNEVFRAHRDHQANAHPDFAGGYSQHMPKIAFGLIALLLIGVGGIGYLNIPRDNSDGGFGAASVVTVSTPTREVQTTTEEPPLQERRPRTQPMEDMSTTAFQGAQVREAKLLAANNSKALASLSSQLVELHQKVQSQVADVHLAQQSTIEVGSLMMEIKENLSSLQGGLSSLEKAVTKNSTAIDELKKQSIARSKPTSSAKAVSKQEQRVEPSSSTRQIAAIVPQEPDVSVLTDYEVLAISNRGAMLRQRSNTSNKFFLLKNTKYEYFGRVLESNTADKTLRGVFPDGTYWAIKGV